MRRGLPVLYCAPPVPIGTGQTGVGEGFEGWRRARKGQKYSHGGVFLVFEWRRASIRMRFWCWHGGEGEGSRRKPETRPHGHAFGFREVKSRPTPKTRPCGHGGVFGFREVKSRPTPKTCPCGRCRREDGFSWVSPELTFFGLFQLFVGSVVNNAIIQKSD